MKTKLSDALWSDCETDEDRFNFLISGRGYETGIIAKAIQHEVAMAFQFRALTMKAIQSQAQADTLQDP